MCGITGFFEASPRRSADGLAAIAEAMASTLRHRGPDDSGTWVDAAAGIALGHTRLAVVDLSPAGHQPMVSACGRFVMCYNGEVYNADALRRDLPGIAFRGHSDTEVLLEGCARWGVEATARRLIGMFAFAMWDRAERCLWLVRDRLGIKPMYWTRVDGTVLFGSELRALRRHPVWQGTINRSGLAAYIRFGYVPDPLSIYEGVNKLSPGRILAFSTNGEPVERSFWRLDDVIRAGDADRRADMSEREATDALEALLRDAVGRRMIADVPLGVFLSGGIDSSTVAALMQAQSPRPVRTFSIGFREPGFDESPYAAAVARHLGTDHNELVVTANDALAVIPTLPDIYDEPFSDSSQIPTYLLSELTRRHVTVALSGDGGDEIFAGYLRYAVTRKIAPWLQLAPVAVRRLVAAAIMRVSSAGWDRFFSSAIASRLVPARLGSKLHRTAEVLVSDIDAFYLGLMSQWPDPGLIVPNAVEPEGPLNDGTAKQLIRDLTARMQYLDSITYLPGDILTKVDRASMAVALEVRVPLIDHRVVEFAWRLPRRFKVQRGQEKWLLRRVLARYVPAALIDRPKMGFGVPLGEWLRGPLRDWAEELLAPSRLAEEGFLSPEPIRATWHRHLSGMEDNSHRLWTILMFEAWRRRWA